MSTQPTEYRTRRLLLAAGLALFALVLLAPASSAQATSPFSHPRPFSSRDGTGPNRPALSTITTVSGWAWENPLPQGDTLTGVSCPTTTMCKAVTLAASILSWNGTAWLPDSSGTTKQLNGVSCASTTMCKAVGLSGTILSLGWDELEHRRLGHHERPQWRELRVYDDVQSGRGERHDCVVERDELESRHYAHGRLPRYNQAAYFRNLSGLLAFIAKLAPGSVEHERDAPPEVDAG